VGILGESDLPCKITGRVEGKPATKKEVANPGKREEGEEENSIRHGGETSRRTKGTSGRHLPGVEKKGNHKKKKSSVTA